MCDRIGGCLFAVALILMKQLAKAANLEDTGASAFPSFNETNATAFSVTRSQKSGYIQLSESPEKRMFYLLYDSQLDPSNDPLIVWFGGGPGCSSVESSYFQHGPFKVQEDLSLAPNPWAWNTKANLLYVDQPINNGFSYGDVVVDTGSDAAADVYAFMNSLIDIYPHLRGVDIHFAGETYAGPHIPAFAAHVLSEPHPSFNVSSVIIGNGFIDPISQLETTQQMACSAEDLAPLLDDATCHRMGENLFECVAAIEKCYDDGNLRTCDLAARLCETEIIRPLANQSRLNLYNYADPCNSTKSGLCYTELDRITDFLSCETTKDMIGAKKNMNFQACNANIYRGFQLSGDLMHPYQKIVGYLLENNIPVLVYSGDKNIICNHLSAERWTSNLEWSGSQDFRQSRLENLHAGDGHLMGKIRSAQGLTYVRINDAGIAVAHDRPEEAQELINSWLWENRTFFDTSEKTLQRSKRSFDSGNHLGQDIHQAIGGVESSESLERSVSIYDLTQPSYVSQAEPPSDSTTMVMFERKASTELAHQDDAFFNADNQDKPHSNTKEKCHLLNHSRLKQTRSNRFALSHGVTYSAKRKSVIYQYEVEDCLGSKTTVYSTVLSCFPENTPTASNSAVYCPEYSSEPCHPSLPTHCAPPKNSISSAVKPTPSITQPCAGSLSTSKTSHNNRPRNTITTTSTTTSRVYTERTHPLNGLKSSESTRHWRSVSSLTRPGKTSTRALRFTSKPRCSQADHKTELTTMLGSSESKLQTTESELVHSTFSHYSVTPTRLCTKSRHYTYQRKTSSPLINTMKSSSDCVETNEPTSDLSLETATTTITAYKTICAPNTRSLPICYTTSTEVVTTRVTIFETAPVYYTESYNDEDGNLHHCWNDNGEPAEHEATYNSFVKDDGSKDDDDEVYVDNDDDYDDANDSSYEEYDDNDDNYENEDDENDEDDEDDEDDVDVAENGTDYTDNEENEDYDYNEEDDNGYNDDDGNADDDDYGDYDDNDNNVDDDSYRDYDDNEGEILDHVWTSNPDEDTYVVAEDNSDGFRDEGDDADQHIEDMEKTFVVSDDTRIEQGLGTKSGQDGSTEANYENPENRNIAGDISGKHLGSTAPISESIGKSVPSETVETDILRDGATVATFAKSIIASPVIHGSAQPTTLLQTHTLTHTTTAFRPTTVTSILPIVTASTIKIISSHVITSLQRHTLTQTTTEYQPTTVTSTHTGSASTIEIVKTTFSPIYETKTLTQTLPVFLTETFTKVFPSTTFVTNRTTETKFMISQVTLSQKETHSLTRSLYHVVPFTQLSTVLQTTTHLVTRTVATTERIYVNATPIASTETSHSRNLEFPAKTSRHDSIKRTEGVFNNHESQRGTVEKSEVSPMSTYRISSNIRNQPSSAPALRRYDVVSEPEVDTIIETSEIVITRTVFPSYRTVVTPPYTARDTTSVTLTIISSEFELPRPSTIPSLPSSNGYHVLPDVQSSSLIRESGKNTNTPTLVPVPNLASMKRNEGTVFARTSLHTVNTRKSPSSELSSSSDNVRKIIRKTAVEVDVATTTKTNSVVPFTSRPSASGSNSKSTAHFRASMNPTMETLEREVIQPQTSSISIPRKQDDYTDVIHKASSEVISVTAHQRSDVTATYLPSKTLAEMAPDPSAFVRSPARGVKSVNPAISSATYEPQKLMSELETFENDNQDEVTLYKTETVFVTAGKISSFSSLSLPVETLTVDHAGYDDSTMSMSTKTLFAISSAKYEPQKQMSEFETFENDDQDEVTLYKTEAIYVTAGESVLGSLNLPIETQAADHALSDDSTTLMGTQTLFKPKSASTVISSAYDYYDLPSNSAIFEETVYLTTVVSVTKSYPMFATSTNAQTSPQYIYEFDPIDEYDTMRNNEPSDQNFITASVVTQTFMPKSEASPSSSVAKGKLSATFAKGLFTPRYSQRSDLEPSSKTEFPRFSIQTTSNDLEYTNYRPKLILTTSWQPVVPTSSKSSRSVFSEETSFVEWAKVLEDTDDYDDFEDYDDFDEYGYRTEDYDDDDDFYDIMDYSDYYSPRDSNDFLNDHDSSSVNSIDSKDASKIVQDGYVDDPVLEMDDGFDDDAFDDYVSSYCSYSDYLDDDEEYSNSKDMSGQNRYSGSSWQHADPHINAGHRYRYPSDSRSRKDRRVYRDKSDGSSVDFSKYASHKLKPNQRDSKPRRVPCDWFHWVHDKLHGQGTSS